MATDLHLFLDELSTHTKDAWITQQIRKELRRIVATKGSPEPSTCRLASVGSYLVFALRALSELANALVHGADLIEYLESSAAGLSDEPSLETSSYLDGKHQSLW